MANLKMVSPWYEYYNKLQAFFKTDPNVNVLFDEDHMDIKIFVTGPHQAEALAAILNPEKVFGEIKVTVTVVQPNGSEANTKRYVKSLFENEEYDKLLAMALAGNELYSDLRVIRGLLGFDAIYVVFDKKVVQYYIDNIGDLYGMRSTLAEDIARDIFIQKPGVFYCTSVMDEIEQIEEVAAPLSRRYPVRSNYNRNN